MLIAILAALLGAAADTSALAAVQQPEAQVEQAQTARHGRKKTNKPAMTGVLNLNRATVAELRLLPGIGKRRAEMIVERREKKAFTSLEEVGRIKGLHALVQRLRPHLAVSGDTTLHPLTATPAKR
jgi:DNA uptake protein ComE-like DNA-binding protein